VNHFFKEMLGQAGLLNLYVGAIGERGNLGRGTGLKVVALIHV
jgi:hypothetical protein